MGVETHAGLVSADFSTKAQGVGNATDGSAGVHGEAHVRRTSIRRQKKRTVFADVCNVTEARRVDGHWHRQVIQSSLVGVDQCVVLRTPRMLSKFLEWRESSRSVVRSHGVLPELSQVCQS